MGEQDVSAPPTAEEADFVRESLEEFREDEIADRENRLQALEDLRFQALRQWSDSATALREAAGRPTFVADMLSPFVRQIDGALRQNPPQARVDPAEDGDRDVAEVYEGMHRSILELSQADQVFANVGGQSAACGMGHFRLSLEYEHDETFDRCLRYRAIANPLAVIRQPGCAMPDHSDCQRTWVFEDITRREFKARFGDRVTSWWPDSATRPTGWQSTDTVRIAEKWVMRWAPGTLTLFSDGQVIADAADEVVAELAARGVSIIDRRRVKRPQVCQYLMTGTEILGKFEWPGTRIPIFSAEGEIINIDGEIVRRGLIRSSRDVQTIRNWALSAAVETVALAPLQKWLATAAQVKGREHQWREANSATTATLIYEPDERAPGPPQRLEPPSANNAAVDLANWAGDLAKSATGMFGANLGERASGDSGRKVIALQSQGETGSALYVDKLVAQMQAAAREEARMLPKVYDTTRQVRILGKDKAVKIARINDGRLDLGRGKYDISISTGPDFKTARQEASQSMRDMVNKLPPEFVPTIAVRLARMENWEGADEIAAEFQQIAQSKGILGQPPQPANQMPAQNSPDTLPVSLAQASGAMQPTGAPGAPAPIQGDLSNQQGQMSAAAVYGAPFAPQERPRPRLVAVT